MSQRIDERVARGDAERPAYFVRESATRFHPSEHVGGGWNPDEAHIGPVVGLLAHVIEADRTARRGADLQLARLSVDILGVLPMEAFDVTVRMVRPGRTIELVEALLEHGGRPAVLARAWLTARYDTARLAGSPLAHLASPHDLPSVRPGEWWPGGFVRSVEARVLQAQPGRATYWMRALVDVLGDEEVSATARVLGLVDIANGATPRVSATEAFFPNVDLTAHLFRAPRGEWTGFDTAVSFGAEGLGLTHSVISDLDGPFGTVEQSLTVRPR